MSFSQKKKKLFIHTNGRVTERRHREIFLSLILSPNGCMTRIDCSSTQELQLGLPHRLHGLAYWAFLCCFPPGPFVESWIVSGSGSTQTSSHIEMPTSWAADLPVLAQHQLPYILVCVCIIRSRITPSSAVTSLRFMFLRSCQNVCQGNYGTLQSHQSQFRVPAAPHSPPSLLLPL